jgi:hypothetical protein
MTLAELKRSVAGAEPPAGLTPALAALWWDAKGDWERAHALIMDEEGRDCAWVHAYMHRREGDLDNAGYWYAKAGKAAPVEQPDDEWNSIAAALLGVPSP